MPTKIDALTPEQEAQILGWVEKWIAKGVSLRDPDEARFRDAVNQCYTFAGYPIPQLILWVDSPIQMALIGPTMHYGLLHDLPVDGFGSHGPALIKTIGQEWPNYIGGRWWLSYSAYTSFFKEVCHLELEGNLWERDAAYAAANEEASWWWPHSHFVVACRPPTAFHSLQVRPAGWGSHVLHNDTGPSIAWRDGLKLYHWMGRRVTRQIIEEPETITVAQIHAESNTEVRRAMLAKFGPDRYVQALGVTPIHIDAGQELYEIPREGDTALCYVRGINGSPEPFGTEPKGDHVVRGNRWFKRYWIRVKPGAKTVHEAVASSYQVPASEYAWPEART